MSKLVVTLATVSLLGPVTHRLPSGPVTMPSGLPTPSDGTSVHDPVVVIRPMNPGYSNSGFEKRVNHSAPSGPAVMPSMLNPGSSGNSVISPFGVIRPILLPADSPNQMLPSGPAV